MKHNFFKRLALIVMFISVCFCARSEIDIVERYDDGLLVRFDVVRGSEYRMTFEAPRRLSYLFYLESIDSGYSVFEFTSANVREGIALSMKNRTASVVVSMGDHEDSLCDWEWTIKCDDKTSPSTVVVRIKWKELQYYKLNTSNIKIQKL